MKDKTRKFLQVWLKDINNTIKQRKDTTLADVEKWFSWVIKDAKQIEGDE